jgi:predicted flap endonuclease-1-like 5' DNA nuclease
VGERDGAEARAQSLEGALREGDGEREEVEARLQGLEVRLRAEQEAHQQSQIRVLELTRLLEAGRRPLGQGTLGLHDARRPRRDDLKEIVGVGPVLERLLHRHGVHSFRQVALWTIDDVRRIDSLLHEFHGRIRRDHWVRQAKTLHRRHHGELLDSPPPGGPDDGDPLRPSP